MAGCALPPVAVYTPPPRQTPSTPPAEEPAVTPQASDPRALASLELTQQARLLLEKDRIDDAISLLERAMTLNPADGKNYYYLAEAWLAKGNPSQAREFNHLAEIYLEDDPEWVMKTMQQRRRIDEMLQ
jgi:predicted Zn-dependent protease